MSAIGYAVQQFDSNLKHRWESLEAVLKGVTDEEARWQAPCYAAEKRDPTCPAPGTILWQLDHISGCNRHYVKVLKLRPSKEIPDDPPRTPPENLSAALEELRASHAALRAEIATLSDADLSGACGHGSPNVGDFLAACLRHEIWHAGQIALVRRLYQTR